MGCYSKSLRITRSPLCSLFTGRLLLQNKEQNSLLCNPRLPLQWGAGFMCNIWTNADGKRWTQLCLTHYQVWTHTYFMGTSLEGHRQDSILSQWPERRAQIGAMGSELKTAASAWLHRPSRRCLAPTAYQSSLSIPAASRIPPPTQPHEWNPPQAVLMWYQSRQMLLGRRREDS